MKLYDIYIRTLYFGIESNSLYANNNETLYRGLTINKSEIEKIINYKNNKVVVFCKAFLSFSKDLDTAVEFLRESYINENICYVFYELNAIEKNEIENYNVSNIIVKEYSIFKNENETLFLPGSSFEIKDIQQNININGLNACKIILSYIGKFNQDFYEIYNNPKKISRTNEK